MRSDLAPSPGWRPLHADRLAGLAGPLPEDLLQSRSAPDVTYRPLCPGDTAQLQQLHAQLFPLNYEDAFFYSAVRGLDNIVAWGAIQRAGAGQEQVVGFVIARWAPLSEADAQDRRLMGLASPACDAQPLMYLLTIGVVPQLRNQGIASELLQLILRKACELECRVLYLHVIIYNGPAISFYRRHGFAAVSMLKDFYTIRSGRQPDRSRTEYDALLFVRHMGEQPQLPGTDLLSTLTAHIRGITACMPWTPRRKNGLYLGNASRCIAVPPRLPPPATSAAPQWLHKLFQRSS